MRLLEENPDEEWVDFISTRGPDRVVFSHEGAEYRKWVRDGRPPMYQEVPDDAPGVAPLLTLRL